MARARNIKPAFFKNELLVEQPFEFRLLFIGLWTLADREGRLEDRPLRIKMELFAADNVDVNAGLDALSAAGFISRYEVKGARYIAIPAWHKHQKPHQREAESSIPAPNEHPRQCPDTAKDMPSPADSLIPHSLIPDSGEENDDKSPPSAARVIGVYQPILDAYHEALPKCQKISVLNAKRKRRLTAAVKLAKTVCEQQGWPYEASRFWAAYFAECAQDPWMRGEVPNPKNPAWRQNLDVLLAEDRFASVMDAAIAAMLEAA